MLALCAASCAPDPAGVERRLADFDHLLEELATGYANLESAAEARALDLAALCRCHACGDPACPLATWSAARGARVPATFRGSTPEGGAPPAGDRSSPTTSTDRARNPGERRARHARLHGRGRRLGRPVRPPAGVFGPAAERDPAAPGGPLFVVIDEGTASAAEMFASLLQTNGAATLVGGRTYGAGHRADRSLHRLKRRLAGDRATSDCGAGSGARRGAARSTLP